MSNRAVGRKPADAEVAGRRSGNCVREVDGPR